MSFKRHPGIGFTHALAIVDHLYQGFSCIVDEQAYFVGTRIYGVFQQLLHSTGGPLNNFASSNLVGNVIGQ